MLFVKVCSEQGSLEKNIGCSQAPSMLLNCLNVECKEIPIISNDIEATDESIFFSASNFFKGKEKCVFLGGDHSITYSLFRAFSKEFGLQKSALIVFDAHADSCEFFKPVSHEDMNKALIEEGYLLPENLLLVGLRKIYGKEKPFLLKNKIGLIKAKEIKKNMQKAKEKIIRFIHNRGVLFVSIDIDCFDPSIAPGTGYREKNGLLEKEFFELFNAIVESKKVHSMDLVEINPLKDSEKKTIDLGRKIIGQAKLHLEKK